MSNLKNSIASISDLMAASGGPQITMLETTLIECRAQVRTDFPEESLRELAADIVERGVQQPIKVRSTEDGRYLVVFGERRLRAARLAGIEKLPAVIDELDDDAAADTQFMENIQREDLNPADLAAAINRRYKQLKGQDVHNAVDVIAGQVKKSKSWVSKHLAIATKLHEAVSELLQYGHTQDVELLLLLNKLIEVKPSDGLNLVHALRAGQSVTRKDVRDSLKKPEQESKDKDNVVAVETVKSDETVQQQIEAAPSEGAAKTQHAGSGSLEPCPLGTTSTRTAPTPDFILLDVLQRLIYSKDLDTAAFIDTWSDEERANIEGHLQPYWQQGFNATAQGKDAFIALIFQYDDLSHICLRALLAGGMGEPFDLIAIAMSTRQLIGVA